MNTQLPLLSKHYGTVTAFIISCLIVFLLWQSEYWQLFENKSFDITSTVFPPKIDQTDIIIVGIDDASFAELQQPWPWPRRWHSQLLARLQIAGAKLVVFDLIFDTPSIHGEEDDLIFAQAITSSPTTFLGSYQQHQLLPEGYQITSIEPLAIFQDAGAQLANVTIIPDGDGTVRQIPQADMSLWQQVLKATHEFKRDETFPQNALTHFIGDANHFPFVSYYRAFNPELLPDEIFKDKIVLVGLNVLAPANVNLQADDRYATPYSLRSKQFMSGIELHANFIDSVRNSQQITPLSKTFLTGLLVLISAIASIAFKRWRASRSSILLLVGLSILTALHVVIFKLRVFVPLFSCLLIWILHYLIQGAFAYQREQKDRRFITKAFSRYVSPHVLKELIQQPEKLTLGGTNKNVTVMFTDLVGFTQLSEKLKAEEIALLLQQYLTIMTDIIVKHGGTLDKYIGDAIMAFWGAPIADDKQSEHALCAAIEMQQACDQFTYGAIRNIQMRIGIHRGDAIVGNMGSDNLFDYTCIGDVVNTAARLESINKQYGTRVMLSETVKNQLRSNHLLQVTDFVKVKGKNNPIKLYSPATSPTVSSFSEKAFQAYQQQEWLQAQEYLNQILNEEPSNSVALRFIERINALEKSPPEDDWDGSFQATEK